MTQPDAITLEEFFRLIGFPDLQPWQLEILQRLLEQKKAGKCHGEPDVRRNLTGMALPRPAPKALPMPEPEKKAPKARAFPKAHLDTFIIDELAPDDLAAGGGLGLKKERAEKKWTDAKLLELLAMFDSGKSPKQIAEASHENLATIYVYLSKAKQLRNDTRLIAADRKQLIAACRMMSAPITVIDNVVRCNGEPVDDAGLLQFANTYRAKDKLPLYRLVPSA